MNWKKRWKKIRRGIKYPILVFFIKVFILIFRLFSRKFVLKVCSGLGKMAFILVKGERKKTIHNLTLIYGDEKSSDEIHKMARQVFVHQALNFGDYVHTLHYTTREQFSQIVEIKGEEHLKAAYLAGNGVLSLMSHTGSWEFSAILPSVMGYKTSAITRPMPNERINDLIVGYRQKRGMNNIGRRNAYPKLMDALEKGECLIIMIDQDTQAKGVFVDFFGHKAYTPTGAARLAMESQSPVLPMFMRRMPNNKHQFTILPPIPWKDTGNEESDLLENTREYTKVIESAIRHDPEQWVWMHERWKTTPADVELFLKRKREKEMAIMQEKSV
jgi:Kdo2-lipid IVA lauroyltransferase/acyltransferase